MIRLENLYSDFYFLCCYPFKAENCQKYGTRARTRAKLKKNIYNIFTFEQSANKGSQRNRNV